ncbi:hypothetical protein ATE92_1621 [Ulvibacter sp. MAR_2010_11]|uniref:hypothetical protein n=1 Tax=Ulvibacter sp. MAR_2010_11 TaxID=1250229 RepID=UPI000C2C95F1|nr:hypothetical protein [Ulvibacter sp. MAR_2010_11]PKA83466.1 hypothetical protein ATE92_1621 [Ulvibacter sp. MAR_2010_11]
MKKIYILLTLVLSALVVTSCSESYDEYETDRGATIGFTFGELELPLPPGASANIPVTYFVTTVSDVDRTFQVVVDSANSDLTSDNYSFDADVVIPANMRRGTMFITLTNNSAPSDYATAVFIFQETADVTSGKSAVLKLKTP